MDYKDFTIQNNSNNYFWHQARRTLIDDLFRLVFKNHDDKRLILEIGCGTGYQIPVLKKWGRVEGLDINPEAVNIATRNGLDVKVRDIEKDDIGGNSFDVIGLFDVLEHIEHDRETIKKIHSSLKNTGWLFLTVPAYNFMFSDHDRAMDHFRRYNKKKLISLLQESGFQVITSGYWNSLLFPGILLMRLIKKFFSLFIKKELPKSEASSLPSLINSFLYKVLMFENFLIRKNIKLPYGLSIFVIAKKT